MERFDILGKLSEGGMGEVLLARATGEHGFSKLVAVKRIRAELSADPEFMLRFVTEAKVTVALSHANIVQVFDLARAGPDLLLVMEYVRGADLHQLLRRARELGETVPLPVLLYLAAEALKGLAHAHRPTATAARGIIHCDISPSNLLLSYAGEVKLTDFGIAQLMARRQTADGRVLGKKRYMSPEQQAGQALDARTDLFALAMVLREALEGRDEADVPAALRALLDQATSPAREQRPAGAVEMLRAISEIERQLEPMVTAPEVGAWVSRLVPPRPEADTDAFAGAVRDLLGSAPRTGTRSAELPPRTFVARAEKDGTTVWETAKTATPAKPKRRWPYAAAAVIVLGGATIASLSPGGRGNEGEGRASPKTEIEQPKAEPAPAAARPPAEPAPPPQSAQPKPRPTGTLNVFADPWASVLLDGRRIGTTPLRSVSLPVGPHRLRLEHPKRKTIEKVVTIVAGRTELVDVELQPETP
ncbi:MAG: protein kinase [Archangiaceae bacterium]|nr:protein kinase [Archangiaceae bacterium]